MCFFVLLTSPQSIRRRQRPRMTSERDIQAERDVGATIWEALTPFSVLFRNNVGALRDRHGRLVRFGLAKGSSDYIGWTSVVVTAEMVGKTVAIFTGIETKTLIGKATKEQLYFIGRVNGDGGRAGIARCVEDAMDIVKGE